MSAYRQLTCPRDGAILDEYRGARQGTRACPRCRREWDLYEVIA